VNDYGRPYPEGFNPISGFSTRTEAGRFAFYFMECWEAGSPNRARRQERARDLFLELGMEVTENNGYSRCIFRVS
jgi:hypothetical protein